jgi:hypothetical protein
MSIMLKLELLLSNLYFAWCSGCNLSPSLMTMKRVTSGTRAKLQTEDARRIDTLQKQKPVHNAKISTSQFYFLIGIIAFAFLRNLLLPRPAMVVQHVIGPACFPVIPAIPAGAESLSVLSYNVLLPNSVDGWWNYKMYLPPLLDRNISSWDYRRDLLRKRLALVGTYWTLGIGRRSLWGKELSR